MAKLFDLMMGMKAAKAQPIIMSAQDEYISRIARDLNCSVESLSFLVSSNAGPLSELEIPSYRRVS